MKYWMVSYSILYQCLLISSNEPLNGAILNAISVFINQFEWTIEWCYTQYYISVYYSVLMNHWMVPYSILYHCLLFSSNEPLNGAILNTISLFFSFCHPYLMYCYYWKFKKKYKTYFNLISFLLLPPPLYTDHIDGLLTNMHGSGVGSITCRAKPMT